MDLRPLNLLRNLCLLALLWLMVKPAFGQNLYTEVSLLKNTSYSFSINPCYHPEVLDDIENGKLTLDKQGGKYLITYDPDNGFTGSDTLLIEYKTLIVGGKTRFKAHIFHMVNSFVAAEPDYLCLSKNSGYVEVDVLKNDTSSSQTKSLVDVPIENYLESNVIGDSLIEIKPIVNYTGPASLEYSFEDSYGKKAMGILYVMVVDSANEELSDTIFLATSKNTNKRVSLPFDGFVIVDEPTHGSLSSLGTNAFEYDPQSSFTGTDRMTLEKGSYTRVVEMEVYDKTDLNSYVVNDIAHTSIDREIVIDVADNDLVKKYPILLHKQAKHGIAQKDTAGVFTFTPNLGFSGFTSFTYKSCISGICEYGEVGIYVGNYAPIVIDTYYLQTHGRYSHQTTGLILNYSVPISNYEFDIIRQPASGSLTYYPGFDTVTFDCDTFSGYNLLAV